MDGVPRGSRRGPGQARQPQERHADDRAISAQGAQAFRKPGAIDARSGPRGDGMRGKQTTHRNGKSQLSEKTCPACQRLFSWRRNGNATGTTCGSVRSAAGDTGAGKAGATQTIMTAHSNSADKTLVLVLGDQLSLTLTSLQSAHPATTIVLMCEVWEEATYVRHHKKKIAFIFSAMRHFAEELRASGWTRRLPHARRDGRDGQFHQRGRARDRAPQRRSHRRHLARRMARARGDARLAGAVRRARRHPRRRPLHLLDRRSSRRGRRAASNCAWSISIATCAARPACSWTATSRSAGNGTSTTTTASRPSPICSCRSRMRFAPDAITRDVLASRRRSASTVTSATSSRSGSR